jgi:hypothetical protein
VTRLAPRSGRTLQLALLWLLCVGGCSALFTQLATLDGEISLEEDVRDDVRESMAAYELRDPAKWQADQRRVDARIDALRRRRTVTLGLLLALGALAVAPIALLVVRTPGQRTGKAR